MRDKDIREIASILFPKARDLILTQPANSRSMTAQELAAYVATAIEGDRCFLTSNVPDALARAREVASENSIILITGSLYLVGEAKGILNN